MTVFNVAFPAAVALAFATTSVPAISEPGTPDGSVKLAFTLEEMNCFSSDIRAREAIPPTVSPGPRDILVAAGTGGTNGIPCDARDPKALSKKKKRS